MSGGYRRGRPPTDLADLIDELDEISRRLSVLERPSGEQLAQVVEELALLVDDIQTQLDNYIATGTYNKAQIDALIANPGNIAPGSVAASGNISTPGTVVGNAGASFPAGVRSTGAYSELVTGGGPYVAAWIHSDGRFGYAPSTRKLKTDIEPARFAIAEVLQLEAFFFRYLASPPYGQKYQREHLGLLAEDTHNAGFTWLVDYDEGGEPFGIRGDMLAAVVLEGLRALHGMYQDLADEVATLKRNAR